MDLANLIRAVIKGAEDLGQVEGHTGGIVAVREYPAIGEQPQGRVMTSEQATRLQPRNRRPPSGA